MRIAIHFAVQLKLTHKCRVTITQLKDKMKMVKHEVL